ncbi:MAG: ABC transporter ATP-binding protein [Candidatus Bathyarchaeia archaeon]|jgi:ABC-2 type transport system ATP-binding protein|nr:ABC transporter ATP-binding protein [Candidatus Bathyarchaeota archaeon A05DMB-4]MDH7595602.1 ABC transporter ATP-binding protein [Candidatus Bathyarchaeota archaeon]
MSLILAENLTKHYGIVHAVDNLSLEVKEDSVIGLIGPNGAGKTTTIKMILGLLRPDKGTVRVFDEDPWDNPKLNTRIGVVHEKAFFPAHHNVLNYLERVCRIFGAPESRAKEVLTLVNLEEASDRKIKALSAGMLQKFAIAHALIHEPKLIVADEMTANLDPLARSSVLDILLKLHEEEKVTFLLSSHILPELSRVCDSVAIINKGRVWAFGRLEELYEKFSAKTVRITADQPEKLAELVKTLSYVEYVSTDSRGVSVRVAEGKEDNLYEDTPKLARKGGVKILGIESGSTSLEELYRQIVTQKGEAQP